jgi:hypothetical protein
LSSAQLHISCPSHSFLSSGCRALCVGTLCALSFASTTKACANPVAMCSSSRNRSPAASSAMRLRRCKKCNEVARYDGSCKTEDCLCFRACLSGCHWKRKTKSNALGKDVASRLGTFIVGGFASTLLHRHDIRVGIASGMFLKPVVPETAKRLELLMCLYPCYWKWSTAAVLRHLTPCMDRLSGATAEERARILENAWRAMEKTMSSRQVVGQRTLRTVELLTRAEAKKITSSAKGCFGYHPYMNPASRRTGAQEFRRLLPDLKSGKVARACAELVRTWAAASGASYRASEQVLVKHPISLFSGARYCRTRFCSSCKVILLVAGTKNKLDMTRRIRKGWCKTFYNWFEDARLSARTVHTDRPDDPYGASTRTVRADRQYERSV